MKDTAGPFLRLTTPLRIWSQRFAFLLLILASVGMIVLNRADPAFLEKFRTSVIDTITPLFELLAKPASAIDGLGEGLRNFASLREENERLRAELAELQRLRAETLKLEAENQAFRAMLNYIPEGPSRFVSARVIADSGSAFVRSVLINGGTAQGIGKGQAAVNGDGLVGRVVDVGERSGRILLITDLNSRIPVLLEGSRDRAVLAGDNSSEPRLVYLPPDAPVAVGERVVTSGHGGVFPPGIPVGRVSEVQRTPEGQVTTALVQPLVNFNRLEMVRVIEYDTSGLVSMPPDMQAAERVP